MSRPSLLPVGSLAPIPTVSNITATTCTLVWPNIVGNTGYVVYENGVAIAGSVVGSLLAHVYAVTGLVTKTTYSFTIAYRNATSVLSAVGGALSVTTL